MCLDIWNDLLNNLNDLLDDSLLALWIIFQKESILYESFALSYFFPFFYYKNEENKLEEKDKYDLIYELINRALGLNKKKRKLFLIQDFIFNAIKVY